MTIIQKVILLVFLVALIFVLDLVLKYDFSYFFLLPIIGIGGTIIMDSIEFVWGRSDSKEKWFNIVGGYFLPLGLLFFVNLFIFYLYIFKKESFDFSQLNRLKYFFGVAAIISLFGQLVHLIGGIYSQKVKLNFITSLVLFFVSYLTCGLSFATLYLLDLDGLQGVTDTNRFIDTAYFSFVTLATTGYGDILPISDYTKLIVIFENMVGLFLTGYVVAMVFSAQKNRA